MDNVLSSESESLEFKTTTETGRKTVAITCATFEKRGGHVRFVPRPLPSISKLASTDEQSEFLHTLEPLIGAEESTRKVDA